MMGNTHRAFGALCGAAVATWQGWEPGTVIAAALIATSTSHGWSSPDMDQTSPWVRFNRWTPGALDPLLAHRRLSHWWGLPVLAWLALMAWVPGPAQWPFLALLVGWASHLLGDAIFGKVPLMPWGGLYAGLGLSTGGFIETGRARLFGRERKVVPFGPVKLAIVGGLAWLVFLPTM